MIQTTDAVRNGVDTSVQFATLNAIHQQPEFARFRPEPLTMRGPKEVF